MFPGIVREEKTHPVPQTKKLLLDFFFFPEEKEEEEEEETITGEH